MHGLLSEVKHALRGLVRSRTLLVSGVLCLALGIGANATMLGILDTLLFRPPAHVVKADSLKRLFFTDSLPGFGEFTSASTSYPVYADLRRDNDDFSAMGAFATTDLSLDRGAGARKVRVALVTASFLSALGVKPVQGRLFTQNEGDIPAPSFVALASHELWRRDFAGESSLLGKELRLGRALYTIVGVLPSGFTGVGLEAVDLWLPINAFDQVIGPGWNESRGSSFLHVVGRLRPGVAVDVAQRRATQVLRAGSTAEGPGPTARVSLHPIQRARTPGRSPDARIAQWIAGVSFVVLAIAGLNVANLLLVRWSERRREIALRLALGAGRARIAMCVLAESVVLTAFGGAAALAVAIAGGSLLRAFLLPEGTLPGSSLDLRRLALFALPTLGAALLCGVVPALWASRTDPAAAGTSGVVRGMGRAPSRLQIVVLAGQMALTLVLLVAAGLFIFSLRNVRRLDLGLDVGQVLVATTDLEGMGLPEARSVSVYRSALDRIRSVPGVEHASLAAMVPFHSSYAPGISLPGRGELPSLPTGGPYLNAVSEDFFATVGMSVRRGRALLATDREGAMRVAVVNETMAGLLWPGEDPLGKCLGLGGPEAACSLVVGVVEDARRLGLQEGRTMQLYVPIAQAPSGLGPRALLARVSENGPALRGTLRREVQALDPELPFVDVHSLADLLEPQVRPWRLGMTVFTLLSLLALVLGVVGIGATTLSAMIRRTYDLAIRGAVGARPHQILWLVVRQGIGSAALGAGLGLAAVLVAGRAIEPLLFQVSARDPGILAGAVLVLMAAATVASCIPGWRVLRLDLASVLRAE